MGPVVSAGTDLALPASRKARHEPSGHCRCRHARSAHRLPRHEPRRRSRSRRDGTPRPRRSGSDRPVGRPGCAPPGCPGLPPCGGSGWRAAIIERQQARRRPDCAFIFHGSSAARPSSTSTAPAGHASGTSKSYRPIRPTKGVSAPISYWARLTTPPVAPYRHHSWLSAM